MELQFVAKVKYPRTGGKSAGNVTKYRAEYAERVYPMALLGMTYMQIGVALGGVDGGTIAQWAKRHPAFAAALRKGTTDAAGTIAISLFNRAKGGQKIVTDHQVLTKRGKRVTNRTVTELPADVRAGETFLKAKLPGVWGAPGGGGTQVNVQVNNNLTGEQQCVCHPAPGESWEEFEERKDKVGMAVRKKIMDKLLAMSERVIDHVSWKVEDVIKALHPLDLPPTLNDQICEMVREYRLKEEKGTPLVPSYDDPIPTYHYEPAPPGQLALPPARIQSLTT